MRALVVALLACACAAERPPQRFASVPLAFEPAPADRKQKVLAAIPEVEKFLAGEFDRLKLAGFDDQGRAARMFVTPASRCGW